MITYSIDSNIKPRNAADLLTEVPEVIYVNKFEESAVEKFRTSFYKAEQSKQDIIPVVIDSYGGHVYSLLAMVDLLKSSNKTIATIVSGKAMSCGAILLSAGTEGYRFVGPNATVMIHDVSSMSWGKVEDIKADAAESERLNQLIYKLLAQGTGKSEKYFLDLVHDKSHADWFLTAEDCVKHNIANHIKLPQMKVSVSVKHVFE